MDLISKTVEYLNDLNLQHAVGGYPPTVFKKTMRGEYFEKDVNNSSDFIGKLGIFTGNF